MTTPRQRGTLLQSPVNRHEALSHASGGGGPHSILWFALFPNNPPGTNFALFFMCWIFFFFQAQPSLISVAVFSACEDLSGSISSWSVLNGLWLFFCVYQKCCLSWSLAFHQCVRILGAGTPFVFLFPTPYLLCLSCASNFWILRTFSFSFLKKKYVLKIIFGFGVWAHLQLGHLSSA